MLNNKKNLKPRMISIEETNARLEEEFAQQNAQGQDLPLKQGESKALDECMRASSSWLTNQRKLLLTFQRLGQINDPYVKHQESYSPMTVTRPIRTRNFSHENYPRL
jgi:hypothetical protein